MAKNLVVFILFISTPYPTRHLQLVLEVRPTKRGLVEILRFKDSNKCYLLICKFLFILFFLFSFIFYLLLFHQF